HSVHFAGFVQYDGLPRLYALADALLLPSLKDTWGLVVNEAMASGLPAVVPRACGCADHLVEPGGNGYIINPIDEHEMKSVLLKLSNLSTNKLSVMREKSLSIIQDWGLERFASSLWEAAQIAFHEKEQQGVSPMARFMVQLNRSFRRAI